MRPAKKKKSLFSSKLAALRRSRGLTQAALAEALGVDRGRVCYWENQAGNPTASTLGILADHFGVRPDYFLTESQAPHLKDLDKLSLEDQKRVEEFIHHLLDQQ